MNCLCEKDSGLFFSHSTSWGTSESEVQQSSVSKSLSSKVEVLAQQLDKNKTLNFQFHELDSSSTQSYTEIAPAQSGQISLQHSSCTLSRSGGKSTGSHDFTFHPPLLDHSQSLDHISCHYADPCYTGKIAAAYGPQSKPMGTAPVRMPLPFDLTEEPIYVNSKQYHAILRRRQYRAKLEAHNKTIKDRKPYLHESRHLHAIKRARGAGGRFLNTRKVQESKLTTVNHGLNVRSSSHWNVSENMHQVENHSTKKVLQPPSVLMSHMHLIKQ